MSFVEDERVRTVLVLDCDLEVLVDWPLPLVDPLLLPLDLPLAPPLNMSLSLGLCCNIVGLFHPKGIYYLVQIANSSNIGMMLRDIMI